MEFTVKRTGPVTITYAGGEREVIPVWRLWLARWFPVRRRVTRQGTRVR